MNAIAAARTDGRAHLRTTERPRARRSGAATPAAGAGALSVLSSDMADLCGALHALADAAAQRGDEDLRGALRLLARQGEGIAEGIERAAAAEERAAAEEHER